MPPAKKQCLGPPSQQPEPCAQEPRTQVPQACPAEKLRWTPSSAQHEALKRMLQGSQVPILSSEEAEAMLGRNPRLLGAGAYGEEYLNSAEDLVVKFAF